MWRCPAFSGDTLKEPEQQEGALPHPQPKTSGSITLNNLQPLKCSRFGKDTRHKKLYCQCSWTADLKFVPQSCSACPDSPASVKLLFELKFKPNNASKSEWQLCQRVRKTVMDCMWPAGTYWQLLYMYGCPVKGISDNPLAILMRHLYIHYWMKSIWIVKPSCTPIPMPRSRGRWSSSMSLDTTRNTVTQSSEFFRTGASEKVQRD